MHKNSYTELPVRAPIYGEGEKGWKPMNVCFNRRYGEQTIPIYTCWFGSWQLSLQRRVFSSLELSRRYDRAAPRWERKLRRFDYLRAYESLFRNVLVSEKRKLVEPPARVLDCGVGTGALSIALARVLDCGVGTGALSIALARVLVNPFKLDAIDISPRMLDCASYSLLHADIQATFRQADVSRLPYDDEVFDLVMSAHVLEHLVDPKVAIKEMVRVLKPGGCLLVCLTRRSALGMFVRLKWRTHWVSPEQLQNWLCENGLQSAHCLASEKHMLFKQLSLACVGKKSRL